MGAGAPVVGQLDDVWFSNGRGKASGDCWYYALPWCERPLVGLRLSVARGVVSFGIVEWKFQ